MKREFSIPGTNETFVLGLAEDTPPHLEKLNHGARWVLMHRNSGWRMTAMNEPGQVSFLANWAYRQFPERHWVWGENDISKVRTCLEPVLQKAMATRDWSAYQEARHYEIEKEMTNLAMLLIDNGITDKPEDEETPEMKEHLKQLRVAGIIPPRTQ